MAGRNLSEAELVVATVETLAPTFGWSVIPSATSGSATATDPDLILTKPGVTLAVKAKTAKAATSKDCAPRGGLSVGQAAARDAATAAGWSWVTWSTEHAQEIVSVLSGSLDPSESGYGSHKPATGPLPEGAVS